MAASLGVGDAPRAPYGSLGLHRARHLSSSMKGGRLIAPGHRAWVRVRGFGTQDEVLGKIRVEWDCGASRARRW